MIPDTTRTCVTDTAVDSQYGSTWHLRFITRGNREIGALPGQREWSQPEHDMTEGIMMLAEDKRPEATLLSGLGSMHCNIRLV